MGFARDRAAKAADRRQFRREQKNSPVFAMEGSTRSRGDRNNARKYNQFVNEGYYVNDVVRLCCDLKATSFAAAKWDLYDKNTGEQVEEHPILDLLMNPNPNQSRQQFWEQAILFGEHGGGIPLHAHGIPREGENRQWWGWVGEGEAQREGVVKELYTYLPSRLEILAGDTGVPREYLYQSAGQIHFLVDPTDGNSRISIVKYGDPGGGDPFTYGAAPVRTCAYDIDIMNEVKKANLALLENRGPEGYWTNANGELTKQQVDMIKDQMKQYHQGAANSGRAPFLPWMQWVSTGLTGIDGNYENVLYNSGRAIARALGVPPVIIGIPGDNTYANMEKAYEAFWLNTMLPLMNRVVDTLNSWLVPMWDPNLELRIDHDSIIALEPLRQERWDQITNADFLTTNEKRTALGWEPLPEEEANTLMVPANVVPMSITNEELKSLKEGLMHQGFSDQTIANICKAACVVEEVKALPEPEETKTLKPGEAFQDPESGAIWEMNEDGKLSKMEF